MLFFFFSSSTLFYMRYKGGVKQLLRAAHVTVTIRADLTAEAGQNARFRWCNSMQLRVRGSTNKKGKCGRLTFASWWRERERRFHRPVSRLVTR